MLYVVEFCIAQFGVPLFFKKSVEILRLYAWRMIAKNKVVWLAGEESCRIISKDLDGEEMANRVGSGGVRGYWEV